MSVGRGGAGEEGNRRLSYNLRIKPRSESRQPQLPQDILVPRDGGHVPSSFLPPPKAGPQLSVGRTQTTAGLH